jgi:hypothetical protein
MKADNYEKSELIKFIKDSEPTFKNVDLDSYSVTQLIIIKVGIESVIKDSNKKSQAQ